MGRVEENDLEANGPPIVIKLSIMMRAERGSGAFQCFVKMRGCRWGIASICSARRVISGLGKVTGSRDFARARNLVEGTTTSYYQVGSPCPRPLSAAFFTTFTVPSYR